MSTDRTSTLAVVTGASTGIGLELARCAAQDGCDLIICAEEQTIETAAIELRKSGVTVDAIQADLATEQGLDTLWQAMQVRDVDYLMANAGVGLGHAFLDQEWDDIQQVIDLNVTGTTSLVHRSLRNMRSRGGGRILITGSIAGYIPGSFHAVYNASKAYLDTLSAALVNEIKDSSVTITCLMPGPTDTEFFERAGMQDTPIGKDDNKADAAKVARAGYQGMLKGESGVTPGFMNKVQTLLAGIVPDTVLAEKHRSKAEPEGVVSRGEDHD